MGIVDSIRGFLSSDFNKILVIFLIFIGLFAYFVAPGEKADTGESFVHFFYLPTCPHCAEQYGFNDELIERYGIDIIEHDVSTPEGSKLFKELGGKYQLKGLVPTTIVGESVFVGYTEEIGAKIEDAIKTCIEAGCESTMVEAYTEKETFVVSLPFLGEKDLRSYSLPVLSILLGLIDGFNPCAMWMLVYLISLVVQIKSRARVWLIVGTFVLAEGILYFLFMTAWLNAFLLIGYMGTLTLIIGLFALGAGILHLKEFIVKKGAVECKIEDAESKQKTMNRMKEIIHSPLTLTTVAAIIVLAFIVNSVEFVCSAALPAIYTQILALSNLSFWQYYSYMALYNVFYMLDDIIILAIALTSINAMGTNERYVKVSRVIGGVLLVGIGLVLLFAPHILR